MLAHRGEVALQSGLPQVLVASVHIVGVGRERDLGIDDQALLVGQVENHIGPQAASLVVFQNLAIVVACDLHLIVQPFLQAREVEYLLEHHFSPVALHLAVAAQGLGELTCFLADAAVHVAQVLDLLLQGGSVAPLLRLVGLDGGLEGVEVVFKGIQDVVEALLVGIFHGMALLGKQLRGRVFEHE